MSDKPGDESKSELAALAKELAGQIASLSAFAGSGLESRGISASRQGSTSSAAGVPSYAGPRTMLENASRFVSPVLPAGAGMRPVKAALLRVLRIVTRDQTTFNSALLESLRGALLETEASLGGLASTARQAAESARFAESATDAARERFDRAVADLSAVSERIDREAAARESAGRNLAASQRRIDALEKDRDDRFEALARERERDSSEREESGRRLDEARESLRMLRLEWSSLRSNLQTLAKARAPLEAGSASLPVRADDPLRAGLYVDFEEHFRGSEADIRARQAKDAARFRGAAWPVADLGCGRGEFLEALKAEGVKGIGCDANPVMAARAAEKGLAVEEADLFAWLGAREDGSLSGITAFQVVEHLAPTSLFDLVELSVRKLATGGRVLFETVNPESVYAMRWFWMDLTHVRPVPAPSLAQLLRATGFKDVAVDFRSPVPESESLPEGLSDDPRFAPLARLLFAPQDYAVSGVK